MSSAPATSASTAYRRTPVPYLPTIVT
jgi:hypothetical protein